MKTTRIENEPEAVYFGDHGKPSFGSSAIRTWLDDDELFYHRYVAKDVSEVEPSRAMFLGHVFEEWLLDGKEPMVAEVKTAAAKAVTELQAANPDLRVIAGNERDEFVEMVNAVPKETIPFWRSRKLMRQVTYRKDMGPFYLQARVDAEVDYRDVPESVARAVDLREGQRLLIDIKTCATLFGRMGFAKAGIWQYRYPVQEELYRMLAEDYHGGATCSFRFFAVAKDGTGSRWVRYMSTDDSPEHLVAVGVDNLANAYLANLWTEFKEPMQVSWVPDNYMRKGLE